MATFDGTPGNDSILGTPSADLINGIGGNDTLNGGDGDDLITGGDGDDLITGGGGAQDVAIYIGTASAITVDLVSGLVTGGAGNDALVGIWGVAGTAHADSMTGNASDNAFMGGQGNDTLHGGAGFDWLYYIEATGGVTVDLGNGTSGGADGKDSFSGFEAVFGTAFNDSMVGDDYGNTFVGGAGNDTIDGGGQDADEGFDLVSYHTATSAVTVDLSIGRGQNTLGAGTDKLIDIEAVVGSAYGDTLEGSEADERFTGGLGNDSIDGGDGIDTLLYTTYLTAGAVAGVDVDLSTGTATGGAGDDTFSGIENVTGSNFDDTLTGDADDNRLLGEGGSDVVNGLDGADLIGGGDGNDTLLGGSSGDLLMGGGGNDSLDGGADDDQLSGDVGDDTLLGQDGTDMLYGGTGNDRLEGGLGGDLLFGEDGDDTLEGGTGYEILDGGNGDDSLLGGDGNDYIEGGAGDDFVQGGAGDDAMDGGAGLDTAGFTLGRSAYTLTRTASGFSVSASGSSDGTDNLIGVERLKFADLGVALDLDDHAGTVVKILGAIFGAAMAASPVAVGIGLGLIDGGMSEAALMQYALDVRLGEGFTPAAEVDLLFQNLVGVAPTAEQLSYWTGTVTSGQYTPVALAQMAADLDLNTLNIGLVGLIDSGVTFTW